MKFKKVNHSKSCKASMKELRYAETRKMRDTIMNVSASGSPASIQLPGSRSVLGEKELDGISEQTHASVISGEPNGKYAKDNKRQVTWRDLP